MSRLFMFPGQGSQYIGMGKDIYEAYPEAREVFELAKKVTGIDVASMCFEENEKINITEYTQICMLCVEAAILEVLKNKGISYDYTAGLSLGEYGALIASNAMSVEDAFKVVRQRGIFMQNAVPAGGAMSAIIGLEAPVIEDICSKVMADAPEGTDENNLAFTVSVANYNNPKQSVITGRKDAVEKAAKECIDAGALKAVELNVSGPFHSSLLIGAGEKLRGVLDEVKFNDIKVKYIANVTADYVENTDDIKELLVKQVSSSVKWNQTLERFIADGVDEFVEIGPGHSLTGFVKKIDRSLKTVNIDTLEDLNKYLEQ